MFSRTLAPLGAVAALFIACPSLAQEAVVHNGSSRTWQLRLTRFWTGEAGARVPALTATGSLGLQPFAARSGSDEPMASTIDLPGLGEEHLVILRPYEILRFTLDPRVDCQMAVVRENGQSLGATLVFKWVPGQDGQGGTQTSLHWQPGGSHASHDAVEVLPDQSVVFNPAFKNKRPAPKHFIPRPPTPDPGSPSGGSGSTRPAGVAVSLAVSD
jgi:hypothetical protein